METRISSKQVVIIGGGPAGVAAAVCLKRRGIGYTLLERGDKPLSALRRVDPDMRLLSPKGFSRLPGMTIGSDEPDYLPFRRFVNLLETYIERHEIEVETGSEVIGASRSNGGFSVQVRNPVSGAMREIAASHVINATGIASFPKLPPNFNAAECSFAWKHSLAVRASDLAESRRLLVVGGGSSAAEVLDRWLEVRREDDRAWLSLRSRLKAFSNPILGIDVHYWVWLPELLPSRLVGWRAGRIPEPMSGGRVLPAIRRGLITRVPAVVRYEGDSVVTASGEILKPDFVAFATGFDYDAAHLGDLIEFDPDGRPKVCCSESVKSPGVYLLGFRFGRTFASPYIRGIARDAEGVASKIARD